MRNSHIHQKIQIKNVFYIEQISKNQEKTDTEQLRACYPLYLVYVDMSACKRTRLLCDMFSWLEGSLLSFFCVLKI